MVVPVKTEGAAFGISTGDGILGVIKVQLEGKKAVEAAEFLRGQRQFIGAKLDKIVSRSEVTKYPKNLHLYSIGG